MVQVTAFGVSLLGEGEMRGIQLVQSATTFLDVTQSYTVKSLTSFFITKWNQILPILKNSWLLLSSPTYVSPLFCTLYISGAFLK